MDMARDARILKLDNAAHVFQSISNKPTLLRALVDIIYEFSLLHRKTS